MATTLATLPRLPIHRHQEAANPRHLPKNIGVAIPITSPLASLWFSGPKFESRNVKVIALLSGGYVAGMLGYAFALVWRVCALVYRVLKLIGTLIGYAAGCCSLESLKYTAWKTLRRFLEVISATAGVVCPPAGYFFDRQIDRLADQHEEKCYISPAEDEMSPFDALTTLGFSENDTPSAGEITEAYRARVRRAHPDKRRTGDDTVMQALNNAKDRLKTTPPGSPPVPLRFRPLEFS